MLERLQKIIARAGIASRRHAEELIASGMVTVNGKTVTELGSKADETKDHIKVSGKLVRPETERVYMILNKPAEVVSTMSDPEGRRALSDLLHGVGQRVFPVGRLEYHSMGLVFLTNDGDLANSILKSHHLPQTYQMKLKSLLTFEEIENLGQLTGARITRIKGKDAPWYEVTIADARRDALRNRLFQTGHPVEKIKRIKIGNVAMESLPQGHHRPLSDAEVGTLRKSLVASSEPAKPQPVQRAESEQSSDTPDGATANNVVPFTPAAPTTAKPAFAAGQPERRPQFKRVYRPKPKPGEQRKQFPPQGKRPCGQPNDQSGDARDSELDFNVPAPGERSAIPPPKAYGRFAASFEKSQKWASGDRERSGSFAPKPGGQSKPFRGKPKFQRRDGQGFGGFDSGRPERTFDKPREDKGGRPQFGSQQGGRPDRPSQPFGKKFGGRPFEGPRENRGDRPDRPFNNAGAAGARPAGPGKPFQKSFSSNRPPQSTGQGGAPSRPPFRDKKSFGSNRPPQSGGQGGAPSRPPFRDKKNFGSNRPFREGKSFGSDRPRPAGGSFQQGRPSEPGAFGKPNKTGGFKKPGGFKKGGKPGGFRGPKRGGPGSPRPTSGPKPGGFRGPRGS